MKMKRNTGVQTVHDCTKIKLVEDVEQALAEQEAKN